MAASKRSGDGIVVERTVRFYRAFAGYDRKGDPTWYRFRSFLRRVAGLAASDEGRYQEIADGHSRAGWTDGGPRFRLAHIRQADLPQVHRAGRLKRLRLAGGAGLAEQTHFVFFSNGVVRALFNFYGPRPERLEDYVRHVLPDTSPAFRLEPLLHPNTLQLLKEGGSVRGMELKVRAAAGHGLGKVHPSLGRLIAASAEMGGTETIVWKLSVGHKRDAFLRVKELLRSLLVAGRRGEHGVEGLRVRLSGGRGTLDLLSDRLVSRQEVLQQDRTSKALDPESAYSAIERARSDLRDVIEQADSLGR